MIAASTVRDPGAAAELAAEAVRALNHLTLAPPSAGTPGWEDVTDLYRVLTEVRVVAERLTQGLGQLTRHLDAPIGSGYRSDSDTVESSEILVVTTMVALEGACVALRGAGYDLGLAQGTLAHLAPRGAPQD